MAAATGERIEYKCLADDKSTCLLAMRVRHISVAIVLLLSASMVLWKSGSSAVAIVMWGVAQMTPHFTTFLRTSAISLQEKAWDVFPSNTNGLILDVPVLDVTVRTDDIILQVEEQHGRDWRQRPLYLKGLWNISTLRDPDRRLSLEGLLREEMKIPYFTDSTKEGALSPDAEAPLRQVVFNISQLGSPHKIGTQLLVQKYPNVIQEVAPIHVLKQLFGSYFEPQDVVGSGPFRMLPALTTVPLFVAAGRGDQQTSCSPGGKDSSSINPRTDLHCEPIGNVAVQLMGKKHWTLVSSQHTFQLKPSLAPDGRAFFASFVSNLNHVPRYSVITKAGDALWVPTWMWHRVDYAGEGISVGASLFHFRPLDFVRNNALFAALIIPAILKELLGVNTQ